MTRTGGTPMVKVSCQQCEVEFNVRPYKIVIGKGKYCSRRCYSEVSVGKKRAKYRRDKQVIVPRVCKQCGKTFEVAASQVKAGHGIMCSRQCNGTFNGKASGSPPAIKNCKRCGNEFTVSQGHLNDGAGVFCGRRCYGLHRTENKQAILKSNPFVCQCCGKVFVEKCRPGRKRQFCSNACRGKANRKEKKAPLKRNSKHHDWAKEVVLRDKKCVRCGVHEKLQAHHIKSHQDCPELRYDINNGVSLCAYCHHAQHPTFPLEVFVKNGGKTVRYCAACETPFIQRRKQQRGCSIPCGRAIYEQRKKTKLRGD